MELSAHEKASKLFRYLSLEIFKDVSPTSTYPSMLQYLPTFLNPSKLLLQWMDHQVDITNITASFG